VREKGEGTKEGGRSRMKVTRWRDSGEREGKRESDEKKSCFGLVDVL
jgi:hypothetical protein